jgi:hypothetical protein
VELSPRGVPEWDWPAYFPGGTVQMKATDGTLASRMQFWAAIGHSCGPDFVAEEFLKRRPAFAHLRGLLRDLKSGPWTLYREDMGGR